MLEMSEVAQDKELQLNNHEVFPRDGLYLVVCSHGRSRSKFIARQLDALGYSNVRIMGLRDSFLGYDERVSLMMSATVVICASSTEVAEVNHLLKTDAEKVTIISVDVSERDHYIFSSQSVQGKKNSAVNIANDTLSERLVALGFADVSKI